MSAGRSTVQWPLVVGIVAVCAGLGTLETIQLVLGDSTLAESSWWVAFWRVLPAWLLVAVLSPIAVWASDRWPVRGPRWRGAVLRHAVVAVCFSVLHFSLVVVWGSMRPGAAPGSFLDGLVWLSSIYLAYEVLTYGALVGTVHAFRFHRESEHRSEEAARLLGELDQARLRLVEGRLHPHFVFNTLNAIIGLAARGDHRNVERTLSAFSELLQVALDDRALRPVPLREELELLEQYLRIQQARFGDRLSVSWEVAEDTLDHEVPGLILQPLVENALGHAISRSPGGGTVTISASRTRGALRLQVDDTGASAAGTKPTPGHGIGLHSVRVRLQALYGDQASVSIGDRPGGGKSVVAFIPAAPLDAATHVQPHASTHDDTARLAHPDPSSHDDAAAPVRPDPSAPRAPEGRTPDRTQAGVIEPGGRT